MSQTALNFCVKEINLLKNNKYYVKINIKNVTLTIYKQIVEAYFFSKINIYILN